MGCLYIFLAVTITTIIMISQLDLLVLLFSSQNRFATDKYTSVEMENPTFTYQGLQEEDNSSVPESDRFLIESKVSHLL